MAKNCQATIRKSLAAAPRAAQWFLLLIALAVIVPGPFALATAPAMPWQELVFAKSYLWVDASARVSLEAVPTSTQWPIPKDKPIVPLRATGSQILWKLDTSSSVATNREQVSALLNPADLRVLQRSRSSYGKQQRLKTYQYFAGNLLRSRQEPAPGEEALPSRRWTHITQQLLPYPAELAGGAPLTSVNSLLVALSLAPLAKPGDVWKIPVHTDLDFYRVEFRVSGREEIPVNFKLTSGASSRQVAETRSALVVQLRPVLLGKNSANDPFEFMGMTGDISILLDPVSRLPLQLRGVAPRMGNAAIDLTQARAVGPGSPRTK